MYHQVLDKWLQAQEGMNCTIQNSWLISIICYLRSKLGYYFLRLE